MSYTGKKRPNEYASKSSHSHIIRDEYVSDFLNECELPKPSEDIKLEKEEVVKIDLDKENPIKHIVAIDGGYSEVPVRRQFPSATITFFQFGAVFFSVEDLEEIDKKEFIDPKDVSKLRNIQRIKFVFPTKNVNYKKQKSFLLSSRKALFDFFTEQKEGENNLAEGLKWLIFEEFSQSRPEYSLASCPNKYCSQKNVPLKLGEMKNYQWKCPTCNEVIYLTDVFRLHEVIDEDLGAGGVLGYLVVAIEQLIIVDLIRLILEKKPRLLNEILIIKDGPLGFFGQTARLHDPMRKLCNFLTTKHNLFLVGLEKSGVFVEHANEIKNKLPNGSALLLDNRHIYKYIKASSDPSTPEPYGQTSYYGSKILFKSKEGKIYVAVLPTSTPEVVLRPKKSDFVNLDTIFQNIQNLKCDMYDDALFPIALANKLVSLAQHPSSTILEKFAKKSI